MADWLARRENRTAFGGGRRRPRVDWEMADSGERMSARRWRGIQEMLRHEYEAAKATRYDRTAQRLRRLGKTVGLTPTDADILELMLRYQTQPLIESLIDDIFGLTRRIRALNLKEPALPALLGRSARSIQVRLGAEVLARCFWVWGEENGLGMGRPPDGVAVAGRQAVHECRLACRQRR